MSEAVDYQGEVTGFKDDKEKEEFVSLASGFQNADVENSEEMVYFTVDCGWRGGGQSCEEIVKSHFKKWLDEHKHIKFSVSATYLEQAPTETVFERS